jgi:hypothetical protein
MNEHVLDATELMQRIRGIFWEVPGTRLSVVQAARLAGVDPSVCRNILESLAEGLFLKPSEGGTFMLR